VRLVFRKFGEALWGWWQGKQVDTRIFWYFVCAYFAVLDMAFFYFTGSLSKTLLVINLLLAYVIAKISAYSLMKMLE
jgi:hypothetical protein